MTALINIAVPLAASVGSIWVLVEFSAHLDNEKDPKFGALRQSVGLWLTALPKTSFSQRVSRANELFFHWFDALFHGKGTLLEQGLWLGLIFSPVMLLLIRLLFLATRDPIPETSRMLLFAMALAFVLSIAVVAASALPVLARRLIVVPSRALVFMLSNVLCAVLASVLASVLVVVLIIAFMGMSVGGLGSMLGPVLLGVLLGVLIGRLRGEPSRALVDVLISLLTFVLGILLLAVLFGVFWAVQGGVFSEGLAVGSSLGAGSVLGLAGLQLLRFHLAVHPLRSSVLSLVTVFILGVIMRDASVSFYHLLLQDGPIVLSYVAFNVFADGISLLETRWVLRRSLNLGLLALLGLVLLDLALSAGIFLFLPLVLRELPSFWQGMFFRGSQPWLGILFWSTFSTSALFYLFVGAVLSLILPGHGLARLFHRTVGQMITIESRPFTAIAWGMILLLVVVFAVGWTGAFLYRLAVG